MPTIKNLHLIVSVLIIIMVAFAYGLFPGRAISILLDLKEDNINLKQVFRAIMGLYLGMAALWIAGLFQARYWYSATLSAAVFFGGLAFGRIIGIIADGIPSNFFRMGMIIELFMFLWSIINLKKYHLSSFNKNPPPGAR
jgi:hypothetical protein